MSCLFLAALQPSDYLLKNGLRFGSLVCFVSFVFVTFPYNVSGEMWYLLVSISDLCLLLYFYNNLHV